MESMGKSLKGTSSAVSFSMKTSWLKNVHESVLYIIGDSHPSSFEGVRPWKGPSQGNH
ncbi:hypothetical protein [Pseudomonas phage RWG]|uniref:Uncharacterized protein n=1 Tax=Pseudomonas phage RWG TaxID=1541890 RepID=A0A346CM59_9CAUD|nr:hypothetical protein [Pseudomonas phage RWG]